MKIYNYDNKGIYLNELSASKDPLESKKQDKDVYLIPNNATDIKPPSISKDEVAVFDGGEWSVVEDYRGEQYYLVDDSNQHKVVDIGPLPAGAILGENIPAKEEREAAEQAAKDALDVAWVDFDAAASIASLKSALKTILGK